LLGKKEVLRARALLRMGDILKVDLAQDIICSTWKNVKVSPCINLEFHHHIIAIFQGISSKAHRGSLRRGQSQ
jgi:hypothetical protein